MTTPVSHVHHIESLEKAPDKAFDWSNLMSVCVKCHNRMDAKQAQGKAIVVFGPIGSGKSYYVNQHRKPEDMIVDLDRIIEALGAEPRTYTRAMMPFAAAARDAIIQRLRHKHDIGVVWIVTTNRALLDQCVQELGASVVRMAASREQCEAQIRGDASRNHVLEDQITALDRWFDGQ